MTMLSQPVSNLPSAGTLAGDVAAGATLFSVILNHIWTFLPGVVTVIGGSLAILWYCIQVWESKTVQTWHLRRQSRAKMSKIAKLKAKGIVISAELDALELRRVAAATAVELVAAASADAKQEVAKATVAQAVADVADPTQRTQKAAPGHVVLDLDGATPIKS